MLLEENRWMKKSREVKIQQKGKPGGTAWQGKGMGAAR